MIIRLLTTASLATSFLLFGCASAPPKVEQEARQTLRGNCLTLFLDSRYQYVAMVNGRAAFALADDEKGQICGAANNHDIQDGMLINLPPIDRLEALALQRCEQSKPQYIKAPCRLYARGSEIVWKKSTSSGMK
jgi:hypothetical protein